MLRPDPRPDLRAAHSMDSAWFAVDARGEVRVMVTGEPGAIPAGIDGQDPANGPVERAIAALSHRSRLSAEPDRFATGLSHYVVVGEPEDVSGLWEVGGLWLTEAPLDPRAAAAVRARVGVRGMRDVDGLYAPAWEATSDLPFVYEPIDDPGRLPATDPVAWDDLPESVRTTVAAAHLPVEFATARRIDLVDHFQLADLQLWGPIEDWLDAACACRPSERSEVLTYAITRYFRPAGHHDDEAGWWFPLPRLPARIDPPHRVGDAGWITQRFAPDADD